MGRAAATPMRLSENPFRTRSTQGQTSTSRSITAITQSLSKTMGTALRTYPSSATCSPETSSTTPRNEASCTSTLPLVILLGFLNTFNGTVVDSFYQSVPDETGRTLGDHWDQYPHAVVVLGSVGQIVVRPRPSVDGPGEEFSHVSEF